MFHVRKRSSFHAAMVILILDAFAYANDWQDAGSTAFWACAGIFWLAFAFRKPDPRKARDSAMARRAFYRHYFGALAGFAPWIPYLSLLAAYLTMRFAPSVRWLVWVLLCATAVYLAVISVLLSRFTVRWRLELSRRVPEEKEPWQGADGIL